MSKKIHTTEVLSTSVKGTLATLPGTGALLQVWNDHEQSKIQRSLEVFREAFAYHAKENEKKFEELNLSQKEISERLNNLERIFEKVGREPEEPKVAMYATMANNVILIPDKIIPQVTKRTAILTLDELTLDDIGLLRLFGTKRTYQVQNIPVNTPFEILVMQLAKLESRGLISQTSGKTTITMHATSHHWREQWLMRYYEIIPYGLQFLHLTQEEKQ